MTTSDAGHGSLLAIARNRLLWCQGVLYKARKSKMRLTAAQAEYMVMQSLDEVWWAQQCTNHERTDQ